MLKKLPSVQFIRASLKFCVVMFGSSNNAEDQVCAYNHRILKSSDVQVIRECF
jgi:hypothetical protein